MSAPYPISIRFGKLQAIVSVLCRQDTGSAFSFIGPYARAFFLCLIYHFIVLAVHPRHPILIGTHYQMEFPLVLISGVAMMRLFQFGLRAFHDALDYLKSEKLLEWLLVTSTSLGQFAFGHILWKGSVAATEFAAFVIFAHFLLGTGVSLFFYPAVLGVIGLMILSYAGLGMIISSVVLLTGKGRQLFGAVMQMSMVLGGVFFPAHLLPGWLHVFSSFLPVSHAVFVIRHIFCGASLHEYDRSLIILLSMAAGLSVGGYFLLRTAIGTCRRNGRL